MKSLLEKKEVTHVVLPPYGVAILQEQGSTEGARGLAA